MTAIVTTKYRILRAKSFRDTFSESVIYAALGKSTPWANEGSPDTPVDSVLQTEKSSYGDLLFAKKLTTSDTSLAIRRIDWVSGTIYDQYSQTDSALQTKNFYVVTDEFKVYKVLSNNTGGASTVKPTSISTVSFSTADSYVWKFMYQLSTTEVEKFANPAFVAIKELLADDGSTQWQVQQAAVQTSDSPLGGHGKNPVSELYGFYAIVSKDFRFDESGVATVSNDFRKIILLKDPKETNGSTPAVGNVYSLVTTLALTSTTGTITADQTVTTTGGGTAKVVDYNSGTGVLRVTEVSGTLSGTASTATGGGIIQTVTQPGFSANSGDVIYVENKVATSRGPTQIERVQIIVTC